MVWLFALLTFAQASPTPSPAFPSPMPSVSAGPALSPSPLPSVAVPTVPALVVSPTSVAMNPAQQSAITVSNANGALQATLDQRLVSVSIDQTTHTVTLTASQAVGSDTLHLVDSVGARADIPVRVAFNAGTIPKTATLRVTGNPLDPAWLAQQVQALVGRLVTAMPGAQTTIAPVTPQASPLPVGAQAIVPVPVTIAGAGQYFDQSDTTNVTVQNVPVDSFLPSLLYYDDDPERVNADGVLYRGTIAAGKPVRLYYYHDDGTDPRRVVVALTTQSQDPTSVQAIDASAGPNLDVMSVGHAVTKNFLAMKPRNQGVIVDLPQDGPYLLHDLAMTTREGVAGNIDLQVLSGGPVTVTVLAVSPDIDPTTLLGAPVLPDDGHRRTGVFSIDGFGNDALTYTAGGPNASVVYADRDTAPPSTDPASLGHDYGDYGVLRTVVITLHNPTDQTSNAYLYERPIGGIVRSSFLVDGALIEVGCVRLSVPYQIAAYALAPDATYRVVVETMTDGGSNYPVEIGITGIAPQPTAPPISSADGCFPKTGPLGSPSPLPSPNPIASPTGTLPPGV